MNKPSTSGFLSLRLLSTGILLLAWVLAVQAQWEAIYHDNASFPNLEAVAFTSPQTGLAVGANGAVVRTDDGGYKWQTAWTEPNGLTLTAIQFTDPTTAFAVGRGAPSGCIVDDQGVIAQSTNYGTTWQSIATDTSLYDLHFPNPSTGYAVGNCGAVYKTTNGGASWQGLNTGIADGLTMVYFLNDQIGFVGGPNTPLYKTTNGGNNWTNLVISGVDGYADLHFPTANTGYLLTENGLLYKTTNGGDNWSEISDPGIGAFTLFFTDESTGWATGSALAKTTNGGETWTLQSNSANSNGVVTDLFFLNEAEGVAVGTGLFYKTTTGGESLPDIQYLSGNLFHDLDGNCLEDVGDLPLSNWTVRAEKDGVVRYTTTDASGNYFLVLETGIYDLSTGLPNDNWAGCNANYTVDLSAPFDTLLQDMPVQALVQCPVLEVDVSTQSLKHCYDNTYTVRYYNSGTIDELAPQVEVELDEALSMVSSDLPWSAVDGNTYTFDLPTIPSGGTGSFSFIAFLDCNPVVGQTHFATAHIFPDDFCWPPSPDWNEASLVVEAVCEGDSVAFTLKNEGIGNMNEAQEFVITEDHVLFLSGGITLGSGQDTALVFYPEGTTLRLEVDQVDNHPGRSHPSVSYEGCATDSDGNISLGYVNQYPEDDADVFRSIDQQESTTNTWANIKRAYPKGYGDQHYIEANVDLDYHIQFQNNTTDTVYTVIVQDTLSPWLDVASIRQGAASHPYEFTLLGNGVAQFTFSNMALPPSSADPDGSQGFIKFRIRQQADNPNGTQIENAACIRYDYGLNNKTNTTNHQIETDFVETADSAIVFGFVQNENGDGIHLVDVVNQWDNNLATDTTGYYEINGVDFMSSSGLLPLKDSDFLNGVDAYDLYLMQQHVLGNELLDSPYKVIAADVDHSEIVSTVDVLMANQAILGEIDSFPNNESWRFVTEPYIFPVPGNPFLTTFPEAFQLNHPLTVNQRDFTAVKIGDVDLSHNPSLLLGAAEEKDLEIHPLLFDDQLLHRGRTYTIPLYFDEPTDLLAIQMALQWDTTQLALEGVVTNETTLCRSDNFGYRFLELGVITACWFDRNALETNQPVDSDTPLFLLRFSAKETTRLSQSLMLNPDFVDGLSFERKDDFQQKDFKRKLALQHSAQGHHPTGAPHSALEVFPNPVSSDHLHFQYTLSRESNVRIIVFNTLGQSVQTIIFKERRPKGTYTYTWDASGLPEGSYFVQLQIDEEVSAVKRFLVLQ